MRCLILNKQSFYYATYLGKEAVTDSAGYLTGEYRINYSNAVPMSANIAPKGGDTQVQPFGNDVTFDRVIVTDDMNCPIDENSIICIDNPIIENNKLKNYDYIVTKVAKSLNHISYAITKVKVNDN